MAVAPNPKDFQFGIERETTFGTAIDTAAKIGLAGTLEMTAEPTMHRISRNRGIRQNSDLDAYNDALATIPTAQLSGCPLTLNLAQVLLPMLMQKSTDYTGASGTGTAAVWTYAFQAPSVLPDPLEDEGYFATLSRFNGNVAAVDKEITSAFLRSLTLSMDVVENDGLLMVDAEFFGKAFAEAQDISNAPVHPSLATAFGFAAAAAAYKFKTLTIESSGSAPWAATANVLGFALTANNGAAFIGNSPNRGVNFGMIEATMTVRLLHDATETERIAQDARSTAIQGARPISVNFGANDPVEEAGDLELNFYGIPRSVSEPDDQGIVTIEYEGFYDSGGPAAIVSALVGTGASA